MTLLYDHQRPNRTSDSHHLPAAMLKGEATIKKAQPSQGRWAPWFHPGSPAANGGTHGCRYRRLYGTVYLSSYPPRLESLGYVRKGFGVRL